VVERHNCCRQGPEGRKSTQYNRRQSNGKRQEGQWNRPGGLKRGTLSDGLRVPRTNKHSRKKCGRGHGGGGKGEVFLERPVKAFVLGTESHCKRKRRFKQSVGKKGGGGKPEFPFRHSGRCKGQTQSHRRKERTTTKKSGTKNLKPIPRVRQGVVQEFVGGYFSKKHSLDHNVPRQGSAIKGGTGKEVEDRGHAAWGGNAKGASRPEAPRRSNLLNII